MLNVDSAKLIRVFVVCSALLLPNASVLAQQPKPKPKTNTTQRDATRPPGTEQNPSTVPPGAQPGTQNPAAPPGTQQPAPQTPPGTTVEPPTSTGQPGAAPTPITPGSVTTTPPVTPDQEPQEPNFPAVQPRPLPPLPNLTRLGVNTSNVLSLSLNEAIRLALANNNDIEVSRDDVRFAETQLRSLLGVYDPVFALTPTIDHRVTPVQNIFAGGGTSGQFSQTVFSLSPSVNKQFSKGGGNYQVSFSNSRTGTSAANSTLNPFYSSNLALIFTQPLLRNRSIDNNRRSIRIQKKRLEQSDADFRRKTIDTIALVQSAYWDLVFALRDQQVQLDNVKLSHENLSQIEAQIAAGAKAPLVRAEVLTELASREQTLLFATQTVSIAENALKQLILKTTGSSEWTALVTQLTTQW